MSHQIDCTVDTKPMADELKTISKNVNNTTAAVAAMQAAVIAADKKAADLVCNNVNRGFHTLMLSQVSQKIAQLQSNVNSHLLRLNQQTKQLLAIKSRMERDYQRTAERYTKIFNTLNKELRQRVQELDQPIFKFATTEVQTTSNRMMQLTATVPVGQLESVTEAQRILTSNVKYHSTQVLELSRKFIADMIEQKELTNRILLSEQKPTTAPMMIPIMIQESIYGYGSAIDVYVPTDVLDTQNQAAVKGEIYQQVSGISWKNTEISEDVKNEFTRILSDSPASQRVKDTIAKLMNSSENYQTL